ncbi:MAG: bifunctional DNA primase/polymerase [Nitrosomonas sp.]|nr:bifunctional DNA primase/polymerase [Nitrosomonas sp.]
MIKENMSKLNTAIDLAKMGFHIFPLRENSKLPLIKDFPNKATMDIEIIKDWWIDPIMETENDYNIGISTTKFGDNEGLVVIDVDNKGTKKGDETLETLDMLGKELPPTMVQTTPTWGTHRIYRHKEALKQGVNVLGNGLDIRSKGGYIVGAGSTLEGKEYYKSLGTEIAQAPEWLVSQLGKAPEKKKPGALKETPASAKERAIFYLKNEAPESLKGDGGDATAYKVAAKVKDFGVSQTDCLDLMMDNWFDGSGWTPQKLELKIAHAYQYGNEIVGASAPEAQFEVVETNSDNIHYLKKINEDHALIYVEGSHFILHETVDEKGNYKRVFLNEACFKRKFSPFTLQKRGTYATEWLDWPERREFSGVCFTPEKEPRNGYYNLWRGFTCAPLAYDKGTNEQRKGLDMFLHHANSNVCNGDVDLFKWLMAYFAHMVQHPYERPLTTLVFRGSKGVGKNALVDRVGNLLGDTHYVVAHNGRYLTSNFNGHLDSCLCLVLDEAIWSGDKSSEGILKGVTTAPTILIERKGKEPYKVDNLVRLIVIGNEDWLVPASTDERRYGVFDVGEGNKQDGKFFHDMRVLIEEKGGNRLLLDYLQKYDISDINVNVAPKTIALLDQKMSSLEPFENWWFNSLKSGKILNSEFGDEWPETADTHSFRSAFSRTVKEMNIRSRLPDEVSMGIRLRKMAPEIVKTKRRDGERTVHIYKFPTLQESRKAWDRFVGQGVLWE